MEEDGARDLINRDLINTKLLLYDTGGAGSAIARQGNWGTLVKE